MSGKGELYSTDLFGHLIAGFTPSMEVYHARHEGRHYGARKSLPIPMFHKWPVHLIANPFDVNTEIIQFAVQCSVYDATVCWIVHFKITSS